MLLLINILRIYYGNIMFIEKIDNEIIDKNNVQFIIQPSSPLNEWNNLSNCLFEFSEVVGKYFEVSTIPQIHKILNIE